MKKKLRLLNLAKTFIIIIFSLDYPFLYYFMQMEMLEVKKLKIARFSSMRFG